MNSIMEEVEDRLLDLVKEKGIVSIILNYKKEMEELEKPKNLVYTSLDIIDSLMLDFYLNNFRRKKLK